MPQLIEILGQLSNPDQLEGLICTAECFKCDSNSSVILEHQECFTEQDGTPLRAKCHRAIVSLIIKSIADKPDLVSDGVKKRISDWLAKNNTKVSGLVSLDILELLCSGAGSQIMTWVKYESLLIHLIKELVYEPKSMANEVLALSKIELEPKLTVKFCPILGPCAKVCREVNSKVAEDEEVEEKWSEIIEWMGWFMSGEEDQ